ncbi:hypothetical protein CTEN210_00873 [Chaetoceros tenuissimus]|uniref:Uncharacterized protein n=1 Tax=Chaetoceros tenuissimus TaxID=426638 RepID=A0AAD3CGD5_9STRA|nr:hypothetical protein CTEN210_00873 [Chaetoceros tenuissimus]
MGNQTSTVKATVKVESEDAKQPDNVSPNKLKRESSSLNELVSPAHVANPSSEENMPDESEDVQHQNILSPPAVARRTRSTGSISGSEHLGTSDHINTAEFPAAMIPSEDEDNANDSSSIAAPTAPDDASLSSAVANIEPTRDTTQESSSPSESLLLCGEVSSRTPPPDILNTMVHSRRSCVHDCNCPSTNQDDSMANENEDDSMANENEDGAMAENEDEAMANENEDQAMANGYEAMANVDEAMANENDDTTTTTTTSGPRGGTRSTTTSNETSNAATIEAEPSRRITRSMTQGSNEMNLETLQSYIDPVYEEFKEKNSIVSCDEIIQALELGLQETLDENLRKEVEQYLLSKDEFILPLSSKKKKKTKKNKRKRKKKARKRSNQTKSKRKRNEKKCQHPSGCTCIANYDNRTRCQTHRSARCQYEAGCNRPAACDNATRCQTHRSARCQYEAGCNRAAHFDNGTKCNFHRSARCQYEAGCNRPAVCDNATRCRTHRSARCQHEGCDRAAHYDNGTLCHSHRSARCQHEAGCNRAAHFDNATRCESHRSARCQHEGCDRAAVCDNATRCHSHRSARCQHEGCDRAAHYDNATRCDSHRSARCQHEGCDRAAHYDNGTLCHSHRSARCQHEGCDRAAHYDNGTRCYSHREEDQMLQQMIQRTRERWPLNVRELRDVPEPDELRRRWEQDTVVPNVLILRATDGLVHPEARSFCEDKRNVPGCWHATYNPPNQMNPPKQLLQAAKLHEHVISTIPHITRQKKRKLKKGIYFHLQFIGACIYFARYRLTRAELNTEGFCFYVAFAKFGQDIDPGEVFQIPSPDVRFVGSLIGKYYDENIPITPSKWFRVTLWRGLDEFDVEEICPDVGQVIQYNEEDDRILGGGVEE